jgi:membrane protein
MEVNVITNGTWHKQPAQGRIVSGEPRERDWFLSAFHNVNFVYSMFSPVNSGVPTEQGAEEATCDSPGCVCMARKRRCRLTHRHTPKNLAVSPSVPNFQSTGWLRLLACSRRMAHSSLARLRKLQEQAQALLHDRNLPLADEPDLSLGRRFLLFSARVYHSFVRNRCPVRAAALAYTNLLALVPLLAVAVSVSATFLKSQGEQSIQDWLRTGIMKIAPTLGLRESAEAGAALFNVDDVQMKDLRVITTKLEQSEDPLSRYLWDVRFTATNKVVLTNYSVPAGDRRRILVAELNRVVTGPNIYEPRRFSNLKLAQRITALAGHDPQGDDLLRLNRDLLSEAYPLGQDALDAVLGHITGFIANFQSGKLGVTAVLALIFVAISLLSTIETTLNDIYGVTRGRGWFARVVQYWAALTLGPLFFFSAVTLTTWAKLSEQVIDQLPLVSIFMPFFVPVVILTLGCALLYLVMPNTKVSWQAALLGGFVAGLLLQLNSYFNVVYVSRVLTYKQIYGSMAALPLFLLGLYFSWLIVLLGAQVTYAFQNRLAYVQEKKAETVSQRGREFVAVRLMAHIAQRFDAGERPPTSLEMAENLCIPLRLVSQVMFMLMQSALVLEVAGAENGYAPARPLDQISVRDVLQALRSGQGQDLATCDDPARPVIYQEFEAIEHAWEQAAGALSMDKLVKRIAAPSSGAVPS